MCEYDDIPGAQSRQRFPLNGLVAQSRIAYQTAPLLRHEIRPGLFVFAGAGGAVTAVAGAEAVAVVDTGYGPRVAEIRRGMVLAGLGMTEMPGRFAARSCVSNVTKFSNPEIVA